MENKLIYKEIAMKILVIDDSRVHQQSARQTLQGHDLTVVDTYDEAYKLIQPRIETNRKGQVIPKKEEVATPFDVVLTDLLMPTGSRIQKSKKGNWLADPGEFLGPEMPVGFALALNAVLHGAKYVAVVSDGDHHLDPAMAMLDRLGAYKSGVTRTPVRFEMNGSHVGFFRVQDGDGKIQLEDGTSGKNWGEILDHILSAPVTPYMLE